MIHYAKVDMTRNVSRPEVVVPGRVNVKFIPGGSNKRSCSIVVVLQKKLPPLHARMAENFRVAGLRDNIKSQLSVWLPDCNTLVKNQLAAKNAAALRAEASRAESGLHGVRET